MSVDQNDIAAFLENDDDLKVFQAVANQKGLMNFASNSGGIKEAIAFYSENKSPSILVVDISKSELPVSEMDRLREVCSPNVNILVVGVKNEVSLYRDLIQSGAYEYLITPLFSEILESTLDRMLSGNSKVEGPAFKSGKIVGCMGARGGVGTSFIASNLAAMLSNEKLRRVVLLDLDLYFGTLSLNFDLKPNSGLREVFENPARIDKVLLERILTPVNERFFILSAEESLEEKVQYKLDGLEELLKHLSKQFHYVIVDIPHYFNELVKTMILKTNIMVLVAEPTVTNLRDVRRLTSFVTREGKAQRSILVMNKYGQYPKNQIKIEEFEKILKDKVNHTVSYDSVLPIDFLNQGKTMDKENNPLAESIRNISLDILGARQNQIKKRWYSKLF